MDFALSKSVHSMISALVEFFLNPRARPFSLLSTEEKNDLSHRGKAVSQWAKWLFVNEKALLDRQNGEQAIGHKGLDIKSVSPEQ